MLKHYEINHIDTDQRILTAIQTLVQNGRLTIQDKDSLDELLTPINQIINNLEETLDEEREYQKLSCDCDCCRF